jgi:iron(III) transport system substrate-binding protein
LLEENRVRWEDRSDIPITRVGAGTMDLGVAWAHDVLRRIETERLPVELRIPAATGYEVGAVSILKDARDPGSAREFVGFLSGRRAGEIQARTGYRVPLRSDVELPRYLEQGSLENDSTAFYDRGTVLEQRTSWADRWLGSRTATP